MKEKKSKKHLLLLETKNSLNAVNNFLESKELSENEKSNLLFLADSYRKTIEKLTNKK